MKKLLIFIIVLLIPISALAADTEVQDLDAIVSPAGTDVLYVVDDPAGTPASKKITIADLLTDELITNSITVNSSGINWASLGDIGGANVNWVDVEVLAPLTEAMIGDLGSYLTAESDPKVGTLTNLKWCVSDGSQVICATDAPVTTETDPVFGAWDGSTGINWDEIPWSVATEIDLTGVNWDDYANLGDISAAVNWSDVPWDEPSETDLTGINWADYANLEDLPAAVNWDEIPWSAPTELDLTGVNWDDYANLEDLTASVNWDEMPLVMSAGVNWTDLEAMGPVNAGAMNWADMTDLASGGAVAWSNLAEGELTDSAVVKADINWLSIDNIEDEHVNWLAFPTYTDDYYLRATGTGVAFEAVAGTGGGNFFWVLQPQQAKLPASNPMAIDAGNARWRGLFDDTTAESATWEGVLQPFPSGTLKAKVFYSMASATSGTVEFEIAVDCFSDGDAADFDTASFGTVDSVTATVPATAGYIDVLADTSLNGDSCAEGDLIVVQIARDSDDGTNDTATGDAELRKVIIYAE